MQAVVVLDQQVQFAEGVAVAAHRQVGCQQADVRGLFEGVLPEAFVVAAEALAGFGIQPVVQP
ncbi:hypothetical protein D3C80_2141710 [compost metagenome]